MPYTNQPTDAFVVAQSSLAVVLTSVVWARPLRSRLASAALVAGIWMACLVPVELDVLKLVGHSVERGTVPNLLGDSAALATLAMLAVRPRWIVGFALVGQAALAWLAHRLVDSDLELSALHVVWIAVLLGLHFRFEVERAGPDRPSPPGVSSRIRDDVVIFAVGLAAASLVARYVLERACDSSDEWGYSYQAALFARGLAYRTLPHCPSAHENHWVIYHMGRAFAQYTPGWPLFMAPFWRAGVVWLASPVSFGLLCVAVARLARRVAGGSCRATASELRIAGFAAPLSLVLGAFTLINAGSRYSHVFVAAMFAWAVESSCRIVETREKGSKLFWGLILGSSTALAAAARPADGVLLGLGVFVYFVYSLARRRVGGPAFAATAFSFALWTGLTLVILRLQLGEWLKTGYSIGEQNYTWAKLEYSIPTADEWKYGIPLETFAYCFWPCAPALGVLGLIAARRVPRGLVFMLTTGTIALGSFYISTRLGRHRDFGYGPRYELHALVILSVGTGALFGRLLHPSPCLRVARRLRAGGPGAIAVAAVIAGVLRLVPLLYPGTHDLLWKRSALFRAIAKSDLHHAVVTVTKGEVFSGPLLDTQNDPGDRDPNVIIVGEHSSGDIECARRLYADRQFYRAVGKDEVTLMPY